MKVKVMNRLYQMNQKEYQGLLQVASDQVLFGIYAIEKQGMQSCAVISVAALHSLRV